MKKLFQVTLSAIFAIVLFSAPKAFAIDRCLVCTGVGGGGGSVSLICDQVSHGGLGARYCFIEWDGYTAYCHTEGDWCCGNGPTY